MASTIEGFYRDIYKLTKSLVIKIDYLDLYMETNMTGSTYTKQPYGKEGFRYYLHISGQRHEVDEDVSVKVIELDDYRPLTKELLKSYPQTKAELLKFEDFYNNLVDQYPEYITYIQGCIYDIDIKEAIKAQHGTILAYNNSFIESQEYNLIDELQDYIDRYVDRWYNLKYAILEPYYLSGFLINLFTAIPNAIVNIRLGNIRSNRAHSFFIENFFNSHFSLWNSVSQLNNETIWWLYRNLSYIISNIGKNSTFNSLLTNVFERNNVGIGGYNLKYKDNSIVDNQVYDIKQLPYEASTVVAELEKLNNSTMETNNVKSIKDILTEEENRTLFDDTAKNFYVNYHSNYINSNSKTASTTKVLEISTLNAFNSFNRDPYSLLLDHWGYLLSIDSYGSLTNDLIKSNYMEFSDPSTGEYYKVNSSIAFLMCIKILLHACGMKDYRLDKLVYGKVFDKEADVVKILDRTLLQDGYTTTLKEYIVNNYPIPTDTYINVNGVQEYMSSVLDFTKNMWLLDSNSENRMVSANIKYFMFLSTKQAKYQLHNHENPRTIDELLMENSVTFKIPDTGYDYVNSLKTIMETFLGVTINTTLKLNNLLSVYKDIISKLTSYTLQTMGRITSENQMYVHYNHVGPIFMDKGLIKLDNDKIDGIGYNDIYFQSDFISYKHTDEIKCVVFDDKVVVDACTGQHIYGSVYTLTEDKIYVNTTDSIRISLMDLPSKEVDGCDYRNPMLLLTAKPTMVNYSVDYKVHGFETDTEIKVSAQDLEQPKIELDLASRDEDGNVTDKVIDGTMVADTKDTIKVLTDEVIVSIEDKS